MSPEERSLDPLYFDEKLSDSWTNMTSIQRCIRRDVRDVSCRPWRRTEDVVGLFFKLKYAGAKGGITTKVEKKTKNIWENVEKNLGWKENRRSNLSFVMYSQFYLK